MPQFRFLRMSAPTVDGKVAVVTGSGRGLGRAYAVALANAGAAVVVNDIDDTAAAETVAALITDAGGRAVSEIAAMGEADAAQAVRRPSCERVRTTGRDGHQRRTVARQGSVSNLSGEDFDVVVEPTCAGRYVWPVRRRSARRETAGAAGALIVVGSPARAVPCLRPDQLLRVESRHRRVRTQLGA